MTVRIDVDFINRVLAQGFVTEEYNCLLDAVQQRLQHLADAIKELQLVESKLIQLATSEIQTPTLWDDAAPVPSADTGVEETKPVFGFEAVLRDAVTVAVQYQSGTLTEGSSPDAALTEVKNLKLPDIPANLEKYEEQITKALIYVRNAKNNRLRRLTRIASLAPIFEEKPVCGPSSAPLASTKNSPHLEAFMRELDAAISGAESFVQAPYKITNANKNALDAFKRVNIFETPDEISACVHHLSAVSRFLGNSKNSIPSRLRKLAALRHVLYHAEEDTCQRDIKANELYAQMTATKSYEGLAVLVKENLHFLDNGSQVYKHYFECLMDLIDNFKPDSSFSRAALKDIFRKAAFAAVHECFSFYNDRQHLVLELDHYVYTIFAGEFDKETFLDLCNLHFGTDPRAKTGLPHHFLSDYAIASLEYLINSKVGLANKKQRFLRDAATGVYGQEVMKTFGKCVFSVYRNATQTEGSNDNQSKLKQVAASINFIVLDGMNMEAAEALSNGLPKIFDDVAWSDLPKIPKNYRSSNEFAIVLL